MNPTPTDQLAALIRAERRAVDGPLPSAEETAAAYARLDRLARLRGLEIAYTLVTGKDLA